MTDKTYVPRKSKLLKKFDKSIARVKSLLISRYGKEQANVLMQTSRQEYEAIIPQIPYIGDHNPSLTLLLPSTRYLAVYRALLKQGGTVEEAGQLMCDMSEANLNSIPKVVRRVIGHLWFSRWFMKRLRKRAKESQQRKYPGDFVYRFVEGDGGTFNYGIDYIECANVKFLAAQGANDLAPYVCATDTGLSEMLGWGLTRTTTIAERCEKCDFRFKKGGQTSVRLSSSLEHLEISNRDHQLKKES